jgi:hypothetical protein
MSVLMNASDSQVQNGNRLRGSRSVRPEIPAKPSGTPTRKPSTGSPARPATSPRTDVPSKAAPSGNASARWVYRGIDVDPAAFRADQLASQSALARSEPKMTYRGIDVDLATLRNDQIQTQAARKRLTARPVYRGIPVRPAFVGQ